MLPVKVKTILLWKYLPLTIIGLHHIVQGKCNVGASGEKLMFPLWHEPPREKIKTGLFPVRIQMRERG
jgi:hypothetical protein